MSAGDHWSLGVGGAQRGHRSQQELRGAKLGADQLVGGAIAGRQIWQQRGGGELRNNLLVVHLLLGV